MDIHTKFDINADNLDEIFRKEFDDNKYRQLIYSKDVHDPYPPSHFCSGIKYNMYRNIIMRGITYYMFYCCLCNKWIYIEKNDDYNYYKLLRKSSPITMLYMYMLNSLANDIALGLPINIPIVKFGALYDAIPDVNNNIKELIEFGNKLIDGGYKVLPLKTEDDVYKMVIDRLTDEVIDANGKIQYVFPFNTINGGHLDIFKLIVSYGFGYGSFNIADNTILQMED
jgi:hypothetical protein